jgi:hypothetical protein
MADFPIWKGNLLGFRAQWGSVGLKFGQVRHALPMPIALTSAFEGCTVCIREKMGFLHNLLVLGL